MRIPHSALPRIRLTVLVAFTVVCAMIFGYLWTHSGGSLPVITKKGYRIKLDIPKVSNLVENSDVMVAGVPIGKVAAIDVEGQQARVTMQLDDHAPLHGGAKIQVREKTLISETFLQVTDGKGKALPNGATLPSGSAAPAVEVDDILASLDPSTRKALGSSLRSLGMATDGTSRSISQALAGLGQLGNEGKTALDALAAQSDDLRRLTGNTAVLLAALNTRRGQISQLVSDGNSLASATAGNAGAVRQVVRQLPGTLDSAKTASGDITELSAALKPVAKDLRKTAPSLNAALRQLPPVASSLRALLPTLNSVLNKAPGTLTRVPTVATDLNRLLPSLEQDLLQVNPMLSYLRPYGQDISHLFVNWGASLSTGDSDGTILRLLPVLSGQMVTGLPITTNKGPFNQRNPYPAPGGAQDPNPFTGEYPRVEKEAPKK
ncbi:virulence factor Mce family protein [Streptomyces albus]|uniref:Virulence factor Mce family protein n=1 Tax=Streptomyces albus (strain ATCC 21838 / DSM 41398 / FERM P-419 / JCM 4703 / NBRC 107858) TaxID=1081613 RepID=A0A0B5F6P9_STRA4|nr:virulence factor Mce family protein [Streptomyces albus]AOU81563.1 virulence factor Mce family protein [Streptomyces albus]AYN37256.1 MCE family protein [Streptomyces albus]